MMKCPHCDYYADRENNYCTECGNALHLIDGKWHDPYSKCDCNGHRKDIDKHTIYTIGQIDAYTNYYLGSSFNAFEREIYQNGYVDGFYWRPKSL